MSTRIRYKEVNGLLVSPEYLAVDKLVKVELNPSLFEVTVFSEGKPLFTSVNQGNMQNAKKLAKRTLVEFGVIFEKEVRPRFSKYDEYKEEVLNELAKDQ